MKSQRSATAFLFTRILLLLAIVFTASIPVFFLVVRSTDVVYVAARVIRYVCVIFFAIKLRKKYAYLLNEKDSRGKYVFDFTVTLIVFSAVLFFEGSIGKIIAALGVNLGFYDAYAAWYKIVLWEQLFNGDLYVSFLTSMAILFFDRKPSRLADIEKS